MCDCLFSKVFFQTYKLSNIKISTSCIHSRGAHSWSQWWRFQQYDWTSWQRSISRAHLTHIQCILYIYNIQCISYTVKIRLGTEVIDKRFHTFAPKRLRSPLWMDGKEEEVTYIYLLQKVSGALYERITRRRRQNIKLWGIPQASNMVSCLISENAWMNGTCGFTTLL